MPLLVQARAHIDAHAGPDRRQELPALRQAVKGKPLRRAVALNAEVLLPEAQRATARARVELEQAVQMANDIERRRHRLLRRPTVEERYDARFNLGAARKWHARAEQDEAECRTQRDAALPEVSATNAVERAEAEIEHRDRWLSHHPTEAAWEQSLAERVIERRDELGRLAVDRQPRHIVQLLRPAPTDGPSRECWWSAAAAIEAYRERWGLSGEALDVAAGGGQAGEWTKVQQTIAQLYGQRRKHSLADRDVDLSL